MRHHFHRCTHLRVLSVPASELHGARRGGGVILEELCDARRLTPCVGLVECDVLTPGQRQDLLIERATRIREQEGRPSPLSGVSRERAEALRPLREALHEERRLIAEENLRSQAELGAGEDRELLVGRLEELELAERGLSVRLDASLSELRVERLDEIDRALEAMRDPTYGTCALCGGEIEVARLRLAPETRVCAACAGEARPLSVAAGPAARP
jgi:RNA polymerase-binding transcription factor DksA